MTLTQCNLKPGSRSTIVHVRTANHSFSFLVRDVNKRNPIYIPEFNVIVTSADDPGTYDEIEKSILRRDLKSDFNRFEDAEEESYEGACEHNLVQYCPTWLGLGRDMRIFQVGKNEGYRRSGKGYKCLGLVAMRNHSLNPGIEKFDEKRFSLEEYYVDFYTGPGTSCRENITRHLEDGALPILHATQNENDIDYNMTAFVTMEKGAVTEERVQGTDWIVAYANTGGAMMTDKEIRHANKYLKTETVKRDEELICRVRLDIVNNGEVPRYAFFKAPLLTPRKGQSFDPETGFSKNDKNKVFAITKLGDDALPDEEISVLLQPGETRTIDMQFPHQPLPIARARKLRNQDYEEHLNACKSYWQAKLDAAARFSVPEKTINESIQAGLLHCDIATLGRKHEGPLLATTGQYSPIGSESAPIIQFFDSAGWHEQAERCLDFFLTRQRDDGFIQTYEGYQLETGPVLWTMGEHFRYTRDIAWLNRVKPNIIKACDYLLKWRERNKKEEFRKQGFYGMIEGKVADPQDFYHSFMLNALSYIGLKRGTEMLEAIDPKAATELEGELGDYREDIRKGFYFTMANAPVVPVGDGSWAPFMPPWVESIGACSLYVEGKKCYSHGGFINRDNIIGPLYLIISEVLDANELGSALLLKANQHPVTKENAGMSQPYYCRHDFAHIKRGEVKLFLKAYYNQLSALHDRETYTFWEHYFGASQHKTHEEAWFLMQTRWMLYLENGNTLELLKAIPRKWLEDGKEINLDKVKSYFGPISLHVKSNVGENSIDVELSCDSRRKPENVSLRLPHPDAKTARKCSEGVYDPKSETVHIKNFKGEVKVQLFF